MQEKLIYDGNYSVTDDGSVFSFISGARKQMCSCGTSTNRRYQTVCLKIDGKYKNKLVHRLVAEAFLPNSNNYPQVNHIDGCPENNNLSNLEWCTNQQNAIHAYRTGLHKSTECPLCGEKEFSKNHKLCKKCRLKIIAELDKEATTINRADGAALILSQNGSGLPSNHFRYLAMRAQGLSYEEIAKIEGCSRQNIHSTIAQYMRTTVRAGRGGAHA